MYTRKINVKTRMLFQFLSAKLAPELTLWFIIGHFDPGRRSPIDLGLGLPLLPDGGPQPLDGHIRVPIGALQRVLKSHSVLERSDISTFNKKLRDRGWGKSHVMREFGTSIGRLCVNSRKERCLVTISNKYIMNDSFFGRQSWFLLISISFFGYWQTKIT